MAEITEPADSADPAEPTSDLREKTMSFLDHLEELRWTLVKSLIVFLVAFTAIGLFLRDAAEVLNRPLHVGLRDNPQAITLITTTPLAIFSVFLMICFLGGITLSLPFILYFVGQFVAPALTTKERRLMIPACAAALLLFLAGGLFSYFLLVPSVIRVSSYMNATLGFQVLWSADRYYSMLVWMVVGMGAAFQFPMVLQILIYMGLLDVRKLRQWRRLAILTMAIVAAVITPTPDPFNMFIVAAPLYLLYEIAIWVGATYTQPRAARARAEAQRE